MAPWSTYRKAASIGAVALAATLTVTACGSDSADSGTATASAAPGGVALVNAGQLTTCTHLPYEPFQSTRRQGRRVRRGHHRPGRQEAGREAGDRRHAFENIKTGAFLNSGKCDVAAAGMTITPERKKNLDFSDPYFDATQALLVKKGSGDHLARRRQGQERQARRPGADHRPGLRQEQGLRPGLLRDLRHGPLRPAAPARSRPSSSTTRSSGLAEEQGQRRRLQAGRQPQHR